MALISDSWMFDISIVLVGVITLLCLYFKRTYSYWDRKRFKSVPGVNYLFGNFTGTFLGKEHIIESLDAIYKCINEPFVGFYTILRPLLLIRDPELIRSILMTDFWNFTDRGVHCNEDYDPLSANVQALPGPKWKIIRGKLTPAFTPGKLKAMFSTLLDCGLTLQNYLDKFADTGEMLDVCELSPGHAINIIASVGFGIDADAINNPNDGFRKCGMKFFEASLSNLIRTFMTFIAPKYLRVLRIKSVCTQVETFIKTAVKQNLEYRERNNVVRKDFFQLMIQLRNSGTVQSDNEWNTAIQANENEKTMTLNEIAAHTFIFFTAGFETTSTALAFGMYELAKSPEIQEKLHNEIKNVIERYEGKITYDAISEMKYLNNCVDEILRKHSGGLLLTRTSLRDYQIPGTTQIIEKGTEVIIPIYSLHRDEKYYEEPLKFNPDRFNEENSVEKNQINRPYYPFGGGPRNCIAMGLGKLQTKVGLVMMLQKHKFVLEDKLKNRELVLDPKSFFLSPVGGIKLHIFKR
ncbi:probable cytochrome P450 6d5 [Sitodiplosis mosellana]|uniref:probable cytochrome P450 6d5 n=1 Tax=Sitodiplosis mosellana TaxID=263140 RepID=UPI002444CC91|nr:probable cytochrome P450 6d5 [Sitodiplosis mosellana]